MEIRESVRWFAEQMEAKLREHDDRPGWIGWPLGKLMSRLRDEEQELSIALISGSFADAIRECADIANFAMMIADNLHQPPTGAGKEENR